MQEKIKKQETLYDAFLECLKNKEFKVQADYIAFKGAEFGAKWQAEKMYSEEEVLDLLCARNIEFNIYEDSVKTKKWFEQFKK